MNLRSIVYTMPIQKKKKKARHFDCGDRNQKMAGNGRLNFIESGKEANCIFMKIWILIRVLLPVPRKQNCGCKFTDCKPPFGIPTNQSLYTLFWLVHSFKALLFCFLSFLFPISTSTYNQQMLLDSATVCSIPSPEIFFQFRVRRNKVIESCILSKGNFWLSIEVYSSLFSLLCCIVDNRGKEKE